MITFITGPVKSGKTKLMIDLIDYKSHCGQKNYIICSPVDSNNKNKIYSRERGFRKASEFNDKTFEKLYGIVNTKYFKDNSHNIFVDEIQFFNYETIGDFNSLSYKGFNVYLSGLEFDSEGCAFWVHWYNHLFDNIIRLKAHCDFCGKFGAESTYCKTEKENRIMVSHDLYGAYCYKCKETKDDFIKTL